MEFCNPYIVIKLEHVYVQYVNVGGHTHTNRGSTDHVGLAQARPNYCPIRVLKDSFLHISANYYLSRKF